MAFSIIHRRELQSRFTSALNMMGTADVYWAPGSNYPVFRQIAELRKRRKKENALPAGAVHVGRYTYGVSSIDFLDDLDEVVHALESPAPCGTGGKAREVREGLQVAVSDSHREERVLPGSLRCG